ncbi:hypothetical protein NBRC116494_25610 [Aurantivibrio plasticivorans]
MLNQNNVTRLILLLWVLLLSSCTFVDIRREVRVEYEGHPLTDELLGKIKPGVTTEEWVLEHIGYPSRQRQLEDTRHQLTYEVKETHSHYTKVFLIFRSQNQTIQARQLVITLDHGVVVNVKTWHGQPEKSKSNQNVEKHDQPEMTTPTNTSASSVSIESSAESADPEMPASESPTSESPKSSTTDQGTLNSSDEQNLSAQES